MRDYAERMRSISNGEIQLIKLATDGAYQQADGLKVVHLRSRASISQLAKYASPAEENDETLIPIDIAIEADRAAGAPVILTAYADILGFDLVPKASAAEDGEISEMDAHRVSLKAMELCAEIFRAREDGVTDALERRAIVDKGLRLVRYTLDLVRRLR